MEKKAALALSLLLLGAAPFLRADDMAAVRRRVKARAPRIDRLLAGGSAGLGADAYLEARGKLSEGDKGLLAAENKDRKAIFAKVAADQGVALGVVERRSQPKFVKRLPAKAWYYDAGRGKWVRK